VSDDAAAIDAIFARHGVRGSWAPMAATGIANRIYATNDVVLRVAVGSEESISDARTESIASPAARAAGVITPALLAFDDSRTLIDRPYSLWERVHGLTVGVAFPSATAGPELWRAVGRELAKLHLGVRAVEDPRGWLDEPAHGTPRALLPTLVALGRLDAALAQRIDSWLARLEPALTAAPTPRFVHDDLHDKNLMATPGGALLALIDWGDAGWGDPALDFASMPLAAVPFAREAYETVAPGLLGDELEARMLWTRADGALGRLEMDPRRTGKLRELLPLIE
jgi:aminoglycoside phosphotransferase (APT) family kinase protein